MAVLEDIAYFQKNTSEELRRITQALSELQVPPPDPEPFPEIFINSGEVQRILKVSANTVSAWVRDGLLTKRVNTKTPINCFRAVEILWIEKQQYYHLSPGNLKRLIEKRRNELGY